MSEKSQELLLGNSIEPPEEVDDMEDLDFYEEEAIFSSSVADLEDHIGHPNFKFVYFQLIPDIKKQYLKRKRRCVKNLLSKVITVYDFEFPDRPDMETDYQINQIFLFIEFLEYDHVKFLSYIWRFLKQDLMKIDIWKYCKSNQMKIIKETEEQLETHPQTKLISKFLRTYYKEKFIEWFATNTEQSKIDISLEIYESEGKLNG